MNKKLLAIPAFAVALPPILFGGAYWSVSHPKKQDLALPADEIAVGSEQGKALLASATSKADYDALMGTFQSQEKASWCGVASSVIVLDALHPDAKITQDGYFDLAPRSFWRTTFGGMPLSDLAAGLEAHGAKAEVHYAEDTPLDRFRELASQNLATPGDYVIVNYDRAAVGQSGGGHISPLGAYDAASDKFLLLDVSAYKYPPMWIAADALWKGMNTPDSESGHSRGFVLVTNPAR